MPNVLITGGNRGIGRELVEQYASDGWNVITTARDQADIADLNRIDNVSAHRLDVADSNEVDRFVQELGDAPIDVFINNAGILERDAPARDNWVKSFEINTIAPTLLAMQLKDKVAASDKKTMAVLTSKVGSIADNSSGGIIQYRSSKAAVNAAWKSLAVEWADDGIGIVMLHPGWVQTDMGGPNAMIDTQTSVSGMRQRIEETGLDNSGRFVDYAGEDIPW